MNLRGMRADGRYVLRSWGRSRATIVISLAMPVILLLAFGLIFGATPDASPIALLDDQDDTDASHAFAARLAMHGVRVQPASSDGDVGALLSTHGAHALIVLTQGFGLDGDEHVPPTLLLADLAGSPLVQAAVEAALIQGDSSLLVERVEARGPPDYRSFLLPGVIGFTILTVGLPLGFTSIAELRHAGLLERLAVSPLTKREWLLARMVAITIIALAVSAFLILVARFALGVEVRITPLTVLLVAGGTLVFSGMGTLLGLLVKTPETGGAVLNLVLLPIVLLSGSFFDVALLPAGLRHAAIVSPLHHLNMGLRADMLAGDAATAMVYAAGLGGFALFLLVVGGGMIRWSHEQ